MRWAANALQTTHCLLTLHYCTRRRASRNAQLPTVPLGSFTQDSTVTKVGCKLSWLNRCASSKIPNMACFYLKLSFCQRMFFLLAACALFGARPPAKFGLICIARGHTYRFVCFMCWFIVKSVPYLRFSFYFSFCTCLINYYLIIFICFYGFSDDNEVSGEVAGVFTQRGSYAELKG